MPFRPVEIKNNESVVDYIINQFKINLENHELKPGDRIPNEAELSEMFNVSRGSIREAMKILSALGVIDIQRGNGTFIKDNDSKSGMDTVLFSFLLMNPTPKELLDFRASIEREVMYLAVDNATEDDIKKLEENIELFKTPVSDKNVSAQIKQEQDMEFHRLLGEATHNGFMIKTYSFVMNYYRAYILKSYKKQGDIPNDSVYTHSIMLEPIKKHNKSMVDKAIEESKKTWKYLLDL